MPFRHSSTAINSEKDALQKTSVILAYELYTKKLTETKPNHKMKLITMSHIFI